MPLVPERKANERDKLLANLGKSTTEKQTKLARAAKKEAKKKWKRYVEKHAQFEHARRDYSQEWD